MKLTLPQQDIYFEQILYPNSPIYNIGSKVEIKGPIDFDVLKKAHIEVVKQHDAYRSVFVKNGENVEVTILSDHQYELGFVDFSHLKNAYEEADIYMEKEFAKPFDIFNGDFLHYSTLIKVKDHFHYLLTVCHHMITDGWGCSLLFQRFVKNYNELFEYGIVKSEYTFSYENFVDDDVAYQNSQLFDKDLAYWTEKFKTLPPNLLRKEINENEGNKSLRKELIIKRNLYNQLIAFANDYRCSTFHVILGIVYAYFGKRNLINDLVIGIPVLNRNKGIFKKTVGLFAGVSPLKIATDFEATFQSLINDIKKQIRKDYRHQRVPLRVINKELQLIGNRQKLFDITLSYEKQDYSYNLINTECKVIALSHQSERVPLAIYIREFDDLEDVKIDFDYNLSFFDNASISRIIRGFEVLLEDVLEYPDKTINELNYITKHEKHQVLVDFNDTKIDYPYDRTIVDLFEEQVEKTPDNIAVVFGLKSLTYKQLNERSNQLARYLRNNYDVKADNLVGIKLDRSEQMVVCIVGILKSGAAYVPIDINYPEERIEYIEQDSKCRVILDEEEMMLCNLETFKFESSDLEHINGPNDLAYVIYTSGTTGTPKGVMIEHKNLYSYLIWSSNFYFQREEEGNFGFFTSLSFDLTITSLFLPLIRGNKIKIFENNLNPHGVLLNYIMDSNSLDIIKLTPSHLELLKELNLSESVLRKIIVGGETLLKRHVDEILEKRSDLLIYNEYGPTECTVGCIVKKISDDNQITIGKPISNTQAYLLDDMLRPVGLGIPGKLYISGAGLARGYLNRPELTAEKFIPNPFVEGERMYDTGDLGRWLPDGNIEFLGRDDHQVKIRGYRIELGEIENTLLQYSPALGQVVAEGKSHNQDKVLIAYYTVSSSVDKEDLRAFLQSKLPDYMVPGFFVELEEMPLTPNGKVDRKKLPGVETEDLVRDVLVAARSKEEKILVSVWEDVLKRNPIGIRDSFFNLGGDSIKSIQVVSRLKGLGYTLNVQHILQVPVLEDLAQYMALETRTIDQSPVEGDVELTPIQHYFFGSRIFKVHHHYNQSVLLKSKEALDTDLLTRSIHYLTSHHDALRMVYRKSGTNWHQYNEGVYPEAVPIAFHDLRESEDELKEMAYLGDRFQSGLDLESGPLLKAGHFRLSDGDRLALIVHHLVVDGVSWRILLEDLSTLYTQCLSSERLKLPLKTDSFQRWASLQKTYIDTERFQSERSYWEGVCSEPVGDFPREGGGSGRGIKIDSSISFSLGTSLTEQLQTQVHDAYNTEINDILLTGLGLAIRDIFGLDKSVIQMEGHGREDIIEDVDVGRTVGWFTSAYPFILDLALHDNVVSNLIEVKEGLRKIPNKGIGYGMHRYLSDGLKLGFQAPIGFNYLGDFGSNAIDKTDSLFEYSSESMGLKMDTEIESDVLLSISGMLVSGRLSMTTGFSKEIYESETMEMFSQAYQKNLESLIMDLSAIKERRLTPSDLTFKGLSMEDLSKIDFDNTLEDVYRLSPLQQGIYYHWFTDRSTSMYFEQMSYGVTAFGLDLELIKVAYDRLVSRHAVLRTSFSNELNEELLQVVRKHVPSNFWYKKLPDGRDGDDYIRGKKQIDRDKGFDLATPSQIRLGVLDLKCDRYEFIWSHHHILADGWCMSVLIGDFYQILNSLRQGTDLDLPKVLPYSNYIQWLDKVNTAASLEYWRAYLDNYGSVASVPFKTNPTTDDIYLESKNTLTIEGDLYTRLNRLCSEIGVTHNSFMQAVWGYLLSRYNNTRDVVFGSVVSGRPGELEGVEDMIGLFTNTVPVRIRYNDTDTVLDLLRRVQQGSVLNSEHHYLNLAEVQSQSDLGMNLLDHIMVFENYPAQDIIRENVGKARGQNGQEAIIAFVDVFERTNYDFNIMVFPSPRLLRVEFKYNQQRYYKDLMENITDHFLNVVGQFVDRKDAPLNSKYISSSAIDKNSLSVFLHDKLPDYTVPSSYVELQEPPLTPNGRIDRNKLPGVEVENLIRNEYVKPRNDVEGSLIAIWEDLLGIDTVSATDNFFELGGHSLTAMKLIYRIHKNFEVKISINNLFKNMILEEQAALIEKIHLAKYP